MGQNPSRPASSAEAEPSSPAATTTPAGPTMDSGANLNEYPPSGRILPGAYLIRNRASGTVLHLLPSHPVASSSSSISSTTTSSSSSSSRSNSSSIQHEIVGWTQESSCLSTMANQTWWVEFDEVYKSYIVANVTHDVVLDVSGGGGGGERGKERGVVVCARRRVRGLASARSSVKSSRRSSVDFASAGREGGNGGMAMGVGVGAPFEREESVMSQRWQLKRTHPTSESFSIHNLLHPTVTLDLDWGKVENNTKIQLRTKTGVNHQQWNFIVPTPPSMTPPVGSWVVFRNRKTDHFLHHADNAFPPAPIRIPKPQWVGIGARREYWGLQWCFLPVAREGDACGGDVRWYIKNRLTGTVLEHVGARGKGESVRADSADLKGGNRTWRAHLLAPGSDTGNMTGVWALENVESGCVLDHYAGKTIQCYSPGVVDPYRQWKIMEACTPFVDHGAANLTPPPEHLDGGRAAFPTLSTSCTLLNAAAYPSNTSLIPLIMPSAESFHYIEAAVWPFPANAPASRDVLGHEERSFFELLSRIETQLLIAGGNIAAPPPTTTTTTSSPSRSPVPSAPGTPRSESPPPSPRGRTRAMSLTLPLSGFFDFTLPPRPSALADNASLRSVRSYKSSTSTTSSALLFLSTHPTTTQKQKRILKTKEGWTSWALGYSSASGTMTHWNNLVESEVVRAADRRDRYVVCFFEAVGVVRELLERFLERQWALLDEAGRGGEGVVVLPSRIVWLVVLASAAIERVVRLRRVQLEMMAGGGGREEDVGMGMGVEGVRETVGRRGAREVNEWVIAELERVRVGWGTVERMCTGRAGRSGIIH